MYIYIILYVILFLGIFCDKKDTPLHNKKIIILFYVLIFALFRGLRWNTGTDWLQFLQDFYFLDWDNFLSFSRYGGDETLEPLYSLLNVLVKFCGGNYTTFLLLSNGFVLYTYYYFSTKYTSSPIITFILLLFCSSFFPVRIELAGSILIWTIPFIINRDIIKYTLIICIAFGIHKSSVIFFPFYWLLRVNIPLSIKLMLYTISTFFISQDTFKTFISTLNSYIPITSVQDSADKYLNLDIDYGYGGAINKVFSYFLAIFFLILFSTEAPKVKIKNTALYNVSVNAYFYMICITKIVPEGLSDLARISTFFLWGLPIVLSIIIYRYLNKQSVVIIYLALLVYCSYRFMSTSTHFSDLMFPYYSIFSSSYAR